MKELAVDVGDMNLSDTCGNSGTRWLHTVQVELQMKSLVSFSRVKDEDC